MRIFMTIYSLFLVILIYANLYLSFSVLNYLLKWEMIAFQYIEGIDLIRWIIYMIIVSYAIGIITLSFFVKGKLVDHNSVIALYFTSYIISALNFIFLNIVWLL